MFLPIILSPWNQCCVRAFLYRARGRTIQHGLSHIGSRLSVTDQTNTDGRAVSSDHAVCSRKMDCIRSDEIPTDVRVSPRKSDRRAWPVCDISAPEGPHSVVMVDLVQVVVCRKLLRDGTESIWAFPSSHQRIAAVLN